MITSSSRCTLKISWTNQLLTMKNHLHALLMAEAEMWMTTGFKLFLMEKIHSLRE